MDGSKEQPQITAGLDLGDKYSYLCLIDTQSGEVIEESRLRTTPEAFRRRFCSERPLRVAIEAGTHSPWVSRLLEECSHEVLVANARKIRLISTPTNAKQMRSMPRTSLASHVLIRNCSTHSSTEVKIPRLIWRSSARAKRWSVAARSWSTTLGEQSNPLGLAFPNARRGASTTNNKAPEHIPEALWPALGPILETSGSLTERIREYDRQLEMLCQEHYPETELSYDKLRESGCSPRLPSYSPWRIPTASKRAAAWGRAYLGLVPARDQSGDRDPQKKRISKEGDEMLRRLLLGSAHYALGPFGSDSDLRRHGEKIASRGAKNSKKRAVVAVARKLSVLLHRLWVSAEAYDPLYNAHRRGELAA
jgi:transposase